MDFTHDIPRRRKLFAAVIMAAVLSACGGGGSGGDAAPAGNGAAGSPTPGTSTTGTPAGGAGTPAAGTPTGGTPGASGSIPGSTRTLPCIAYINTGFNGDINAVYPDDWGGVPQTGGNICSDQGGGVSGVSGDGGASGGDGGAGGDGGSGGGDGGGGDGGAGAGGGEGKVVNALMTVTRLSDGKVLGTAVTDPARGLVTIRPRASDGPVLLTLAGQAGAKYYDEGTGQLTDFGPDRMLHALVDRFDENIGVSSLSEAAYRYALNNFRPTSAAVASGSVQLQSTGDLRGLSAEQVRAANEAVRTAINATLDPAVQLVSVKSLPTPVDNGSAESALPLNRYGIAEMVIGGLAKAAASRKPNTAAPALGITEQVARDLTDGKLDGVALDKTQAAPAATAHYDAKTLPNSLRKGTVAIANRFGKGTTSTITPAMATPEESDFAGQWTTTIAAGNGQGAQNAPMGSAALTIDAAGTISGQMNGAGGSQSAAGGKVANDGTIAFGTQSGAYSFTGAIQSDGTFAGTWTDNQGNSGAWTGTRTVDGTTPGTASPGAPGNSGNAPGNSGNARGNATNTPASIAVATPAGNAT